MKRYNEDFRLIGPKEIPNDPQSRHVNVMDGVFAIDVRKDDLLRFANSGESEEEDGLIYAQFVMELAAAAGALDCYVTHNEYLLRNDPNCMPFTGAPLIDTQRLLEFIKAEAITGEAEQRFPLPFEFAPLDRPYLALTPIPENSDTDGGEGARACTDLTMASPNTKLGGGRAYSLSLGDATEGDIQSFLFLPKAASGGGGGGRGLLGRQDYRMLKKRKTSDE